MFIGINLIVRFSFLYQRHAKNALNLNRGRAAKAKDWNGESGYRLHVSPLNPKTSRQDIEKIFTKFGKINEVRYHIMDV